MRGGGIIKRITALLHSRRKPLEDARDQAPDSDQFPHILSDAGGFLLSSPRVDAGRDVRNYVPAFSAEVEDDGFVTIFHTPEIRRD
jgi:hypothetical protein